MSNQLKRQAQKHNRLGRTVQAGGGRQAGRWCNAWVQVVVQQLSTNNNWVTVKGVGQVFAIHCRQVPTGAGTHR